MNHFMVDLETLGTDPGCVIASIGAVIFNEQEITHEWEANVDIKTCVDAGLTMNPDTVLWWLRQNNAAIDATFPGPGTTALRSALISLTEFMEETSATRFWCHGATFDIPVLVAAYGACKLPNPFSYRDVRDTRTLFEYAKIDPRDFSGEGVAHHAINDARKQAKAVIAGLRQIEKWKTGREPTPATE